MNRIDRLFGMITTLQSKKFVAAEKLSEKYSISCRTVYRDIKALCESGIPVYFEPGKGYGLMQGYFLPPVSFSTEEANALLLIDAIVQGFADRSIQQHYANVLSKVKAVLRASQKENIESLSNNIKLQLPACIKVDVSYLSAIQHAISSKQILEIEYCNSSQERSARKVESIGLLFYALSWHLIAWCHKRQEYRDFKVSRIVNLKNTGAAFHKEDHLQLSDYMKMIPVDF